MPYVSISDAVGNYTHGNLLIGRRGCHLLQTFEGLNYVVHIESDISLFDHLNWPHNFAVFKAAGISREQVWIQHSSQQGDLAIASYETDNPQQSFKVLASSNEPWAVKFREHLKKAHGIDIAQSSNMQLNELLANWKR